MYLNQNHEQKWNSDKCLDHYFLNQTFEIKKLQTSLTPLLSIQEQLEISA